MDWLLLMGGGLTISDALQYACQLIAILKKIAPLKPIYINGGIFESCYKERLFGGLWDL